MRASFFFCSVVPGFVCGNIVVSTSDAKRGKRLAESHPVRILVRPVCLQLQVNAQKENKNGTMSPDSPEPEDSYTLTPRTEAKYNKIDEDFQIMMQRNQQLTAGGARPNMATNSYSLPVSVPVSVPVIGTYNDSMLQSSPQMAHNSISPRPSSSETDSGKFKLRNRNRNERMCILSSSLCPLVLQCIPPAVYWKCQTAIPIRHRPSVDLPVPVRVQVLALIRRITITITPITRITKVSMVLPRFFD